MLIHVDIIKEMKNHLKELADEDPQQEAWLGTTLDEFDKLTNLIQEGVVKPTANLSDLVSYTSRLSRTQPFLNILRCTNQLAFATHATLSNSAQACGDFPGSPSYSSRSRSP